MPEFSFVVSETAAGNQLVRPKMQNISGEDSLDAVYFRCVIRKCFQSTDRRKHSLIALQGTHFQGNTYWKYLALPVTSADRRKHFVVTLPN